MTQNRNGFGQNTHKSKPMLHSLEAIKSKTRKQVLLKTNRKLKNLDLKIPGLSERIYFTVPYI